MENYAYYDHRHNDYDIYGTAATVDKTRELDSLVAGLREDLGAAEQRIRDLEEQVAELIKAEGS